MSVGGRLRLQPHVCDPGGVQPDIADDVTLTLHAVRLLGFADTQRVAARFDLDPVAVREALLDGESFGWVVRSAFGGSSGWSLTDRGRAEGERRLAAELDAWGARAAVTEAHARFLQLNARLLDAITRWQIRPLPGEPMARNDHTDLRWDDRVLEALASVGHALVLLTSDLSTALPRFGGYDERYSRALDRAVEFEHQWVDGVGIDSCHVVWMQLHEDLLATLGIARGAEQ